jgi:biopolymer transport protein ExbB/TolQ
MTFVKEAWAFLKNYWYLPLIVLAFFLGFFYLQGKGFSRVKELFYAAKKNHQEDRKAIRKIQKKERKKKKDTVKKHIEEVREIEEERKKTVEALMRDKEEFKKETIKEYHEEPEKFTKMVSEYFELRVFDSSSDANRGTRDEAIHKEPEEG